MEVNTVKLIGLFFLFMLLWTNGEARATSSFPGLLLSLYVELVVDVKRDEALGMRSAGAIERIRHLCIDFQVSAHNTLPMLKTHNFEL